MQYISKLKFVDQRIPVIDTYIRGMEQTMRDKKYDKDAADFQ